MTLRIVGFEGGPPQLVTWGTPVLSDGAALINPTTQRRTPLEQLEVLAADGYITRFAFQTALTGTEFAREQLRIVVVRKEAPHGDAVLSPAPRNYIARIEDDTFIAFLFTLQRFEQFKTARIDHLLRRISFLKDADRDLQLVYVDIGLTLCPSNPDLNAMRVYWATNSDLVHQFALANLRTQEETERYQIILEACRNETDTHDLHYQHGVSEGGGFDVDVGSKILSSLSSLSSEIRPQIEVDFPYLKGVVVKPRLYELRATGSATLTFRSTVAERPLAERIFRFIELRRIEDALRGKVDLKPSGMKALQSIVRPSEETLLRQKPLGKNAEEPVEPSVGRPKSTAQKDQFTVIGFAFALYDLARRLEIQLLPDVSIGVATERAKGESIEGMTLLMDQQFPSLRPYAFTLEKSSVDGVDRYELHSVTSFDANQSRIITAYPSSVVSNGFVHRLSHKTFVREPRELHLGDLGSFQLPAKPRRDLLIACLRQLSVAYRANELQLALSGRGHWIHPAKRPTDSMAIRLLRVVLNSNAVSMRVDDAVVAFNSTYRAGTSVQALAITASKSKHLFVMDKRVIRVTDEARAYLKAYDRAAGKSQH